ncbi:Hypothetical protein A7982_03861 [Minicystis rosea]|nr:Hypothetical protein A7982_03861 [Minicystis rosea]
MALANATSFAALAAPLAAPDGRDVVLAVVKATFRRDARGRLALADEQVPVRAGDISYFPNAEDSCIRYPGDICVEKRGTDVVIVGAAVSQRPVLAVDVGALVRDRKIHLRVHGERVYYRGALGVTVGPAASFERKPIVWERAYGGTSLDKSVVERRNPVGRGFGRSAAELVDMPAPQIEDPAFPITSAADRPEPVGFGAISAHWSPRAELAGTFDDIWRRTRMPRMPADFDVRHNNVAPVALQFDPPLGAGDPIALVGMTLDGLWKAELPSLPVSLHGRYNDGRSVGVRPTVDTVLIEPLDDRIELTVRHAFPMGRGKTALREIRVDADG